MKGPPNDDSGVSGQFRQSTSQRAAGIATVESKKARENRSCLIGIRGRNGMPEGTPPCAVCKILKNEKDLQTRLAPRHRARRAWSCAGERPRVEPATALPTDWGTSPQSMNRLLQAGPMGIASCGLVCQQVSLLMRDAKDDRVTIRTPGNDMNAAHKKRELGVGLINNGMSPRQKISSHPPRRTEPHR
jgi:hypothetical protein